MASSLKGARERCGIDAGTLKAGNALRMLERLLSGAALGTVLVSFAVGPASAHDDTDVGSKARAGNAVVCVAGCVQEAPQVVYRARRLIQAGTPPKRDDGDTKKRKVLAGIYCHESGGCSASVKGPWRPYRRYYSQGGDSIATVTVVGWWWYW